MTKKNKNNIKYEDEEISEEDKYYHTSKFDVYLKKSQIPNAGLGVYTNSFIEKNTIIDEYYGEKTNFGGEYVLEISDNYLIDAFDLPRCYMAMLNDAGHIFKIYKSNKKKKIDLTPEFYYDKNNCVLQNNCRFVLKNNRGFISSMRDINAGEELFISYGKEYWNGKG